MQNLKPLPICLKLESIAYLFIDKSLFINLNGNKFEFLGSKDLSSAFWLSLLYLYLYLSYVYDVCHMCTSVLTDLRFYDTFHHCPS